MIVVMMKIMRIRIEIEIVVVVYSYAGVILINEADNDVTGMVRSCDFCVYVRSIILLNVTTW
jgi:hypothetical protein